MVFAQYGNFFSVVLFTLFLIPAIVMNLLGRRIKYMGMILNVLMLVLFLGLNSLQMFQFLLFMICEMILIYLFLFLYGRYPKKWIYFGALFCSMIPIILIKLCVYTRFDMLGFVGISYISFRIWQMIIEIRDGHIKKILLLDTLYFITFFPTLSSGPIDRYQRFMSDLNQVIPKKEYLHSYLAAGLRKILRGMIYNLVLLF